MLSQLSRHVSWHTLQAFGCELDAEEISKLFHEADVDHSGSVCGDELAECLAMHHRTGEFYKLMKRCPVDGEARWAGEVHGL